MTPAAPTPVDYLDVVVEADPAPGVTLEDIRAAATRIAPYVVRTPVVAMTPTGLRLKAESLQPTGAFKLRGALNALLTLPSAARQRGVIAHSSGNHAQAVAYAAHRLGVAATIVMPVDAPRVKLEATRRWGAEVVIVGPEAGERAAEAERRAAAQELTMIHPFDNSAIIAGAGTVALEILEQCPDVETIYVPASGGGQLAGVAVAVNALRPDVRVVAAEPALAGHVSASLMSRRLKRVDDALSARTMADGMRVGALGRLNWQLAAPRVAGAFAVSEAAIGDAVRRLAREARLVVEPSGAVAPAAALAAERGLDRAVAVVSGGNVDPERYARLLGGMD